MGFILSLALVLVGAVLKWAVTANVAGIDLQMVGLIVLVIGVVGFVLSSIEWMGIWSWRNKQVEDAGEVQRERIVERRTL